MPEVALITAYDSEGRLLLGRRRDNDRWTLPGGHLNEGEKPADGARRELLEETGLEAETLSPLTTYTLADGLLLYCFSAYVNGEPHGKFDPDNEVEEWKFVDVSEGLPKRIANKLHGPEDADTNLVLRLFNLQKAQEEVSRLLEHPNPYERSMALLLEGVAPKHLDVAALDEDPEVHVRALEHPKFDVEAALRLMRAPNSSAQQLSFLSRPDRVRPEHLEALYRTSCGSPDAEILQDALVKHPVLDEKLARALYADPRLSLQTRVALMQHPKLPEDVIRSAADLASMFPGEHTQVAKAALVHPNAPSDLLEQAVRRALASPYAHLDEIAQDVLRKRAVPSALIHEVLRVGKLRPGSASLRAAAVSGPGALPEHVDELLKDRDPDVLTVLPTVPGLESRHIEQLIDRALAAEPRDDTSLRLLLDHPAFGYHHLQRLLQPVQKSEPLAKAVHPSHFKSLVKASDVAGRDHVDHVSHLGAHPQVLEPEVKAYREQVLKAPEPASKLSKGKAGLGDGITRKVVFKATVPNGAETKYMVKPYHERVISRVKHWIKYPIQGWAEMAHQALYHAAGIGHLHQKVHVSEHDMGHGNEHEPALVVHLSPGHVPVAEGGGKHFKPEHGEDVRKIALMDFLTNNHDRHGLNLLVNATTGAPLAVDHSRSFQYIASKATLNDQMVANALGREGRPGPGHRNEHDNFRSYVNGTALGNIEPMYRPYADKDRYTQEMETLEQYQPVFEWWDQVGPKVRDAFNQHLQQIKDPDVRDHVKRNFEERANWLDERARFGLENFGSEWYRDQVSMYKPGQLTEEEQQNPEYVAKVQARRAAEYEAKRQARAEKRADRKARAEFDKWRNEQPMRPFWLLDDKGQPNKDDPAWKRYEEAWKRWEARDPSRRKAA